MTEYALGSADLRLLTLACESWDRATEAREAISRSHPYVLDRFGQLRPHPALAVERDSRLAFARLVREIGLADSDPSEGRPPPIPGRYVR